MRVTAALKRVLPRTLLGRALMIIVMPLVLLQVVSTWIFYDRHWETVTRRLASAVAGEIASVIDSRRAFPGQEDEQRVLRGAAANLGLRVTFRRGEILPNEPRTTGSSILDRRLGDALREQVRRPFHMDTESRDRQVVIQVQLTDGILNVVVERERLFSSTTYIFVMWMVGTSMVLFAIATVFMRNQVRPIRRLAAAVDNFGKGRDERDFKPEGASEIRQAAAAFNVMRERILRAISQRTEILAGVSHDLRTVLTRMKLQLAMLGDSAEVTAMKADVAEMENMVEEYLAFARGESAESIADTDIDPILGDIARVASRGGANVSYHPNGAGDLVVPVRPNAFRRCVTNLVGNAVKHAANVDISTRRANDMVEILVDDDGPGIEAAAREEVFKPFYRLDSARNLDSGGSGLGLTIARDIIRAHGGDVLLEDSPDGGLRARVRLPV